MSVRGTACFALGLISRTLHGVQMLSESGWETTVDSRGRSLGLCVPRDLRRVCMKHTFDASDSQPVNTEDAERYRKAVHDEDPVNANILKLFVEMGNSVMCKKIEGKLHGMKTRHPVLFTDVGLFKKALVILESHHYRLQAREFILNLFNRSVMRKIVFNETEDEIGSDTS